MAVGGIVLAKFSDLVLHIFSGAVLVAISRIGYVVSVQRFAVIPENSSYWPFNFPEMICVTLDVDITFNVTN